MQINKILLIVLGLLVISAVGAGIFFYIQTTSGTATPNAQYNAGQCDFSSITNVSCRNDTTGKSCPPCEFPSSAYCYVNAPGHSGFFCGCGKPNCNFNVVSDKYVCNASQTDPQVGWSWDGDISCPSGKTKCTPGEAGCDLERQVKGRCQNCSNPAFIKVYCKVTLAASSATSVSTSSSTSSISSSTATSTPSSSSSSSSIPSSSSESSISSSSLSSSSISQPPAPHTAIITDDPSGRVLISFLIAGFGFVLFIGRSQDWLFIKAEELFGEGILMFANKKTRKKVFENKMSRTV